MSAYRQPVQSRATDAPLAYDYAKAVDRERSRVVFNSIRLTVAVGLLVGVYPFVALFGEVGVLIALASFAFVGVPLAIRRAQRPAAAVVEAYEERMLAKTRKRSRKKHR